MHNRAELTLLSQDEPPEPPPGRPAPNVAFAEMSDARVRSAIATLTTDRARFNAAILAGSGAFELLIPLRSAAPAISKILILETDADRIPAMAATVDARPHLVPDAFDVRVRHSGCTNPDYDADGYIEAVKFLTETGTSLHETLVVTSDPVYEPASLPDRAIYATLADLFAGQSERMLSLLGGNLPLELMITWSCHLAGTNSPVHALTILENLRTHLGASAIPGELAQVVASCWVAAGCFAPVTRWLPALAPTPAARAHLKQELHATLAETEGHRRETFAHNHARLRACAPGVADRALAAWSGTASRRLGPDAIDEALATGAGVLSGILCAYSDEVSWIAHAGRTPPILPKLEYAFLFRTCNAGIEVLSSFAEYQPEVLLPTLAALRETDGGVLVGALKPHNILASVITTRISDDQPIYVVEEDLSYVVALMEAIDLRAFLDAKNVHWFVGVDCARQLLTFLQESARPAPTYLLAVDKDLELELKALPTAPLTRRPRLSNADHREAEATRTKRWLLENLTAKLIMSGPTNHAQERSSGKSEPQAPATEVR